jgi:uncharacterized membrane protein
MPVWLYDIIFPLVRWLHLVCMTLIVGGTLFFELVLPIAIDDLRREQQLFLLARARLVFRWVVWISVSGLLLSGAASLYRMSAVYRTDTDSWSSIGRWAIAHMALGALGMAVILSLTIGRRPPENPMRWMRVNLIILLVTIFLGSATRHFQLGLRENPQDRSGKVPPTDVAPAPTPPEATVP